MIDLLHGSVPIDTLESRVNDRVLTLQGIASRPLGTRFKVLAAPNGASPGTRPGEIVTLSSKTVTGGIIISAWVDAADGQQWGLWEPSHWRSFPDARNQQPWLFEIDP